MMGLVRNAVRGCVIGCVVVCAVVCAWGGVAGAQGRSAGSEAGRAQEDRSGWPWVLAYSGARAVWSVSSLDYNGEGAASALGLASPVLGLGGVWLAHGGAPLTSAQAGLICAGGNWGTANGVLLMTALGQEAPNTLYAGEVAGGVGMGLMAYAGRGGALTTGDVAVINSGGLWGAGIALLSIAGSDDGTWENDEGATTLLVGMNAGLALGAALVPVLDVSRGQMALMDLGGGVGLLGGMVVLGGLVGDDLCEGEGCMSRGKAQAVIASTAVGSAALGMALTWWATEASGVFDEAEETPGRAEVFELRRPAPFVRPHAAKGGALAVSAGVDLLHGTF